LIINIPEKDLPVLKDIYNIFPGKVYSV